MKTFKKISLILLTAITILSCSKDDKDPNAEKNLDITYENMKGTWYYSRIIKEDGTVINYPHRCATIRDKWDFTTSMNYTQRYFYYTDCISSSGGLTDLDFWAAEKKITSPSTDTYYITKLTNKEMHLKYDYSLNPPLVQFRTDILTTN